ncbi:MAG: YHS domain-containing protein [Acidobacteriota bacterium]|nr:YHS domain-containing protein [Acidobacteriota bacterium]
MTVTETTSTARSEYQEKIYLFCCSHCKSKFDQNSEQFLTRKVQPSSGGCGCGCGPSS